MLRNLKEKSNHSGITVLGIGITLLIITFASACIFLTENLQATAQGVDQMFGATLQSLIGASIRVMYLGVMGWIGSLVTIRGVNIITQTAPKRETDSKQQANANLKKAEKQEATRAEPELNIVPLEEMEQHQKS